MVLEARYGGRHRPVRPRHAPVAPRLGGPEPLDRGGERRGRPRGRRVRARVVRLRGAARARPRAHRPALWHPHPRHHTAADWRGGAARADAGRPPPGGGGRARPPPPEPGDRGGAVSLARALGDAPSTRRALRHPPPRAPTPPWGGLFARGGLTAPRGF